MEIDLGFYIINLQPVLDFFSQPPSVIVFGLFIIFGWTIFAWMLLHVGLFFLTEDYKPGKATKDWKWVLLAVDIPQLNVQTPKAVEQMFAHLAGALNSPDIAEKYRYGHKQRWFSFEIVSIEGYIQFLIRTEEKLRDLVEASLYAQYPEAEIVEVEDYVTEAPNEYPNETHDVWAADFVLANKNAYPIRTYDEFEHNISKDTVLKDPMGAFLESFSRIGPGEQVWFQMLVQPISSSWKEDAIHEVKSLIGEKIPAHGGSDIAYAITSNLNKAVETFGDYVFGRESSLSGGDEKDGPKNEIQFMTPGQKNLVEAIEDKISKIGFKTKIRTVYLARKEVFHPERATNAVIGSINQFNVPSSNAIVPSIKTVASYFFKNQTIAHRKNLLVSAYKKRKMFAGGNPFILNIEELATIWHFPMSHVKTPLLQKATAKASEPPAGLPIEAVGNAVVPGSLTPVEHPAPEEEKYVTDLGVGYGTTQKFG